MKRDSQINAPGKYRVLMQTRPNVFTQRGGDTVVIEKLSQGLTQRGHSVTIDLENSAETCEFDLVHLFNFATPAITQAFALRALEAHVPYVVTTLYEDVPSFHYQSHYVAQKLIEYTAAGQKSGWPMFSYSDLATVQRAPRFAADEIARHAACLMPNGQGEEDAIRRDFPGATSYRQVPVGSEVGVTTSPELFERAYGVKDFVLCVGRLESRKNQLMLLKALEHSDITVVFATGGFTYQPEYEAAVRSFKRKGRTVFLGLVDPAMLSSAYAACRIHALPSWYELPGLVSLEAAAHGKNVVVTRTGTTADYIGDAGYYCTPWDSDSIHSAVMAAYYAPLQPNLVERACSFSWSNAVATTEDVYREVVVSDKASKRSNQTLDREIVARDNSVSRISNGDDGMNHETPQFNEILEQGEISAKQGNFALADTLLAQAERMNPDSTRVMKARGAVLLARMQPEEATILFDRALAMEPRDPKLLAGRGMCELLQNRPNVAIYQFERALEVAPDYLVALHQLLECSYLLGRFDVVLPALNRYLTLKPEDVEIRFCLAGCLYKSGRIEMAEGEIARIESLKPGHTGAMELLELIRSNEVSNTGNTRTSSASTKIGVAAKVPTNNQAANPSNSSNTRNQNTSLNDSIAELSGRIKAWKIEATPRGENKAPTAVDALNATVQASDGDVAQTLAEVEDMKRLGDFDRAQEILNKLLAGPEIPQPYQEIAQCLRAEFSVLGGDLTESGRIYDEILKINPRSARALCGKGALAAEVGEWSRAKELFTAALEYNADFDVAYAGLGLCAMINEDTNGAFGYFQRATEKNPENHRALLGLLQTGYPLKRFTEIERMLHAYLDLHPASLDILYSFAGVLFAQGKVNEARMEVEKILIFEPKHEHALELREILDKAQAIRS